MTIERVLIHPFPDTNNWRDTCRVWRQWESLSTTRIIESGDFTSLSDTKYLSSVERSLIVGGQAGTDCVNTHLIALAQNARVRNGVVRVSLSREATIIEPIDLERILNDIKVLENVIINVCK